MSENAEKQKVIIPWTDQDEEWLFENMYKLTMPQLCAHLGRNENSIKLKMHRERQNPKSIVKENALLKILTAKFSDPSLFSPNRQFYKAIGIGQRRFWLIYKGLEKLTGEENKRICDYFGLKYTDWVDSLQLTIGEGF